MILFGAHIPNSLKNKIWEGKFIDLSLLVKTASELHDWGSGDIKVKDVRCVLWDQKVMHTQYWQVDFSFFLFLLALC